MKDKIFLSHSSKDKPYVNDIAFGLGKDLCVYDSMCFEEGMKTLDEILNGLSQTSIFVFFISDNSLESDWVKREVSEAEQRIWNSQSKLEQVFPIIIDEKISYSDKRIPEFLKNKFNAYNIQQIRSSKVAARKIKSQYTKRLLMHQYSIRDGYSYGIFYGRKVEMAAFQQCYDEGQRIQCVVASGIMGIGKKSYIVNTLRDTHIIADYYEPPIISLSGDDGIVDLIMKLSDLGFGNYTFEMVSQLNSMDSKIDILVSVLTEIQNCKEHVIIYDDKVIVGYDREPKYWFVNALSKIRKEVTISLAASISPSNMFLSKNPQFFFIDLSTLKKSEWKGLLRTYGESIGVKFDPEDTDFFDDIITGYPPQVIYCAQLAKEEGMVFAKNNGNKVVASMADSIANVIRIAIESVNDESNLGKGLLAFLCGYGIVPAKTLFDIIKLNERYKDYYHHFRALTICRLIGAKGEYIEVNPAVADFVQRNRYEISEDIKGYLEKKVAEFKAMMEKESNSLEDLDFESLKTYLKICVKDGSDIKESLLYSTIYLSAIRELYNEEKYLQVIELVYNLKNNNTFERFDEEVQEQIQRTLCRSLARNLDDRFYTEIEWYSQGNRFESKKYKESYYFLKGFMYRLKGRYDKAIEVYTRILNSNNRAVRREMVAAYAGMEEYEMSYQFAKQNYKAEPNNEYYLKDYFEAIVHKKDKTDQDITELSTIMEAIDDLRRLEGNDDAVYFEIKAKYEKYINGNHLEALTYVDRGLQKNPNSVYLLITKFDLLDSACDVEGMEIVLKSIKKIVEDKGNIRTKLALDRRELIYEKHKGIDNGIILSKIENLQGLSEEAKEKLKSRILSIRV